MEIRDYNHPVAEVTAKIIRERGLKNKAVAEKAGYSEQMLSDMLNGRKLIRIVDAIRIRDALGVDTNTLFGNGGGD